MKQRKGNVATLRVHQLSRLFRYRCSKAGHIHLPDDDSAPGYAAVMLAHLWKLPDPTKRMDDFFDIWMPWLDPEQRQEMMREAASRNQFWTADELGEELGLSPQERQACRITTIGAAGETTEDRARRRAERKAERERERRKRNRPSPPPAAALDVPRSAFAILGMLPVHRESTTAEIMARVTGTQHFRDAKGAPVTRAALRRRVLRAIKDLETAGYVKCRIEPMSRGLPTMLVSLS